MRLLFPAIILTIVIISCRTTPVLRELRTTRQFRSHAPLHAQFIKTHMKDGKVFILNTWKVDTIDNIIHGYGMWLDVNRKLIGERKKTQVGNDPINDGYHVSLAEVALIETNDIGRASYGGLAIVTGLTGSVAIYCAINPKACFGSCPTFYADDGESSRIMAEGFSTSVSPSLERNDIDMLHGAAAGRNFELVVTNEAMETHCINSADLLVFPKCDDEVYVTENGEFFRVGDVTPPASFVTEKGDEIRKVVLTDGLEYFSLADSNDLNTREWINVTFDVPEEGEYGAVIGKRQTLLTTFLMYQGLSYMGNSVGYWMAELERGNVKKREGIFDVLGGIEVYRRGEGGDSLVGELNETGPIAVDFNVVPIGRATSGKLSLKLRLNKGMWRMDYVALVRLKEKINPVSVSPHRVDVVSGGESSALKKLENDSEYLVTYPGDAYKLHYLLPYDSSVVFLNSRGYYLEWIRDEWIREQNLKKFAMMVKRPETYLRKAARQYKSLEPTMEETFWNSRYEKR